MFGKRFDDFQAGVDPRRVVRVPEGNQRPGIVRYQHLAVVLDAAVHLFDEKPKLNAPELSVDEVCKHSDFSFDELVTEVNPLFQFLILCGQVFFLRFQFLNAALLRFSLLSLSLQHLVIADCLGYDSELFPDTFERKPDVFPGLLFIALRLNYRVKKPGIFIGRLERRGNLELLFQCIQLLPVLFAGGIQFYRLGALGCCLRTKPFDCGFIGLLLSACVDFLKTFAPLDVERFAHPLYFLRRQFAVTGWAYCLPLVPDLSLHFCILL